MTYCAQCGAELAGTPYCGKCGARIEQAHSTVLGGGWSEPSEPAAFSENHLGLLAYFTPVPALALLIVEPYCQNRFLRFHSYQCLLLTLAAILFLSMSWTLALFLFLEGLLSVLLHFLLAAAWVWAAYKAWRGQRWQVPIIGELARRKADKVG